MSVPVSRMCLISCVGVENDLPLLPHFLRYYLQLGIDPGRIHIVLNASVDDDPRLGEARSVLATHGAVPAEEWTEPYTSRGMWEKRREIQRRVAAPSDWVISADVDEFHEFPTDLGSFLAYCDGKGVTCVQGVFIDRLAPGGALAPVAPEPSVWDQFPIEADVICTIRAGEGGSFEYGTVNIMACRGDVFPNLGGHHPIEDGEPISYLFGRQLAQFPRIRDAAFRFSVPLRVHHFKWTEGVLDTHRRRLATPGASKKGSAYGRRLLDYFDRRGGRVALDEVPVRTSRLADLVPWRARVSALRATTEIHRWPALGRRVAQGIKRRVA